MGIRRGTFVCGAVAITMAACSTVHPTATQHLTPAPRNPDLTPSAERYYDQIASGHRAIAYDMLSPAYRARLPRDGFEALYDDLADAQIDARQTDDRSVSTQLSGIAHGDRRARSVRERIVYAWDGQDWVIDRIERR